MGVALSGFASMTAISTHESPPSARMNGVLFLLSLSILINYIDRSNLSIPSPLIKGELGITDWQLGTLLAAFFWTYGFMQIPAGWLVDRFDVKWVFAAGFFLWSTATATTGILHGFAALIVIRIILGVGESVAFPSYCKILGIHFSESRRGFANSAIMAGLGLGPAIGILVGGNVVARFGWRPFFLVLGLGALLWLVPWLAWMPRRTRAAASSTETTVGIPPSFHEPDGQGRRIGVCSVLDFEHWPGEAFGPVDRRRILSDSGTKNNAWSGAIRLGRIAGRSGLCTRQHFHMGLGPGGHFPWNER